MDAHEYDRWVENANPEQDEDAPPDDAFPEYRDEDAPPELDEDREDPRAALGYVTPPTSAQQPQGATIATRPPERLVNEACAVCGQAIVIRVFGECPHCQGDRNRDKVARLAEVIREIKGDRLSAEEERRAIKQLRELGHCDVDGFLKAVRMRREQDQGAARGKPRRGA